MTTTKPRRNRSEPDYPSRDRAPRPSCDADRRRFLRQLASGAGAAAVGLPRIGHGQSLATDFGKLDGHASVAPADAEQADAVTLFAAGSADLDIDGLSLGGLSDSDDDSAVAEAEPADEQAPTATRTVEVTENRALWIEPGYLILLRWRRPSEDESVVAALEGSADAVGSFLAERVENVDALHNIDQLHPIEGELLQLLQPRVGTAHIEVLHLDHDCTSVCSSLHPSRTYPEIYEVDGDMPAPGWE